MLHIHAPIKKHYIRANQGIFMNKTLQKAVMTRFRLRNKFLKNKLSLTKLLIKRKGTTVSVFLERKKKFLCKSRH